MTKTPDEIDPEHDPAFCTKPKHDGKPHAHKAEGNPACWPHGMMTQAKDNSPWRCVTRDCNVTHKADK